MYAYCGNNPVNRVDPTGEAWDWVTILDVVLTLVTATAAYACASVVKATTLATTLDPVAAEAAAVATFVGVNGALNNLGNLVYYSIAPRKSLDETGEYSAYANPDGSYNHINRFDRLSHAKAATNGESYLGGGWEYYSEYSAHMYGWMVFGRAINNEYSAFRDTAISLKKAQVDAKMDTRPEVFIPSIFYGLFWGG